MDLELVRSVPGTRPDLHEYARTRPSPGLAGSPITGHALAVAAALTGAGREAGVSGSRWPAQPCSEAPEKKFREAVHVA